MYDIHVGDNFKNDEGREVAVTLLDPLKNLVQYTFKDTGASRWKEIDDFLSSFLPV